MSKMIQISLFIVLSLLPWVGFAHPVSATAALQARLDALQTYQADFVQTTVANHEVTGSAKGQIWIQRPWHLRWLVHQPTQQVLIVHGDTVWNYNPDLMQATKQMLNDQQKQNAAMLLAADGSIAKKFNVVQTMQPGLTQFQLTPKAESPVTHITLNFSNRGLVSMQTVDHLGQTNSYRFSHIAVNHAIAPTLFQFTPPKGVDVLEAGHSYGAH